MNELEQLNIKDIDNEKKPNKVSFIVMIVVIVGLFIYGILSTNIFKFSDNESESVSVNIKLKDISMELGNKISTSVIDYFNDPPQNAFEYKLSIINIPSIDNITTETGEFNYSLKYGDEEYKGSFVVTDTKEPELYLKVLTTTLDEVSSIKIDSFIQYKYDASSSIDVSYKNDTINNIVANGTYYIGIVAKDASGNIQNAQTKLNVVGYRFLGPTYDNIASYNSLRDSNWNNEYISDFNYGVKEESEAYKNSFNYIKGNDWLSFVKNKYPTAIIDSPLELFNIYNQHDLVIGIGLRVTINENGVDKTIFINK